ncbi:MAG: hypothetical protein H0X67_10420 [Acidobacteria bacterium]|nr:hypothetical protein [Acidobacteriota bacterium]
MFLHWIDPVDAGHVRESSGVVLYGLRRFVSGAQSIAGVRLISLVGSIVTTKPNPKDIDVLVVVADNADLSALAVHARRSQGNAQSLNRGADVFLANEPGDYIGRTCRWRDCRPGVRQACDARHCGRRSHLHDDLDTLSLSRGIVASPPVTLWLSSRGELRSISKKSLRLLSTPLQPTSCAGGAS